MKLDLSKAISPTQEQLLKERQGKIGASDSGAVDNLDWGCQRKLTYRVRNTPQDFPAQTTAEMERGIFMEPIPREMLRVKGGFRLEKAPVRISDDRPWMICHQDDEAYRSDLEGSGVAEYKVVHWRTFNKFKKEGIRDSYILQMAHSFYVTGKLWGVFAILCPEPWQFAWFIVKRDQELIDKYVADCDALWAKIENGPLPDPLPPTDIRCQTCPWRRTCQGERLAAVSTPSNGKGAAQELPALAELLPLATELREREAIRDEADELVEEVKGQIRQLIADRPGGIFAGGRVVISRFIENRWDTKALNDVLNRVPALMKYRKQNEKTQMRVYWTGDK